MTHTRTAFVKANWHAGAVGKSRHGRVHKPPLEARVSGNRRAALAM
jgi:hypothetical protein